MSYLLELLGKGLDNEIGDVLDRYRVRMMELRQSIEIIEQCLKMMPGDGAVIADLGMKSGAGGSPADSSDILVKQTRRGAQPDASFPHSASEDYFKEFRGPARADALAAIDPRPQRWAPGPL